MADWLSSMQQTFEFYLVDSLTWHDKRQIDNIEACTIVRDEEESTRGYATIDCTESIGEYYIRIYLITIQNGIKERHVLGTFLIQTPSSSFDGKLKKISIDAYSPLIELKEKCPPIGYTVMNGQNIMAMASNLCRENVRAPIVAGNSSVTLCNDFVADFNDTWLSYLESLIANAKFSFGLDEMGRILFHPEQNIAALQPVWTYTDDNSSILHPDISIERDLYGIPNVVEVLYSTDSGYYYAKVVNDDENSPISTINRGREIVHRVSDPNLEGNPTQKQINEYAKQLLSKLSSLEYTINYTHAYCPVRVGDCVSLNYKRAGLANVKAKVTRQSIKCESGCPVSETAIFTTKLWG